MDIANAERWRRAEVLQATLQRFYAVLASMYTGILMVTIEGCVEYANQGAILTLRH
jgi:PAS domain-containing protein